MYGAERSGITRLQCPVGLTDGQNQIRGNICVYKTYFYGQNDMYCRHSAADVARAA